MRRSADFRTAIRSGVRAGGPLLVIHLARDATGGPPQVGLVIPRTVGTAVARNRLARRVRHLARPLLANTPDGTRVVLRLLPAAADHPDLLAGELERQWQRALTRVMNTVR